LARLFALSRLPFPAPRFRLAFLARLFAWPVRALRFALPFLGLAFRFATIGFAFRLALFGLGFSNSPHRAATSAHAGCEFTVPYAPRWRGGACALATDEVTKQTKNEFRVEIILNTSSPLQTKSSYGRLDLPNVKDSVFESSLESQRDSLPDFGLREFPVRDSVLDPHGIGTENFRFGTQPRIHAGPALRPGSLRDRSRVDCRDSMPILRAQLVGVRH